MNCESIKPYKSFTWSAINLVGKFGLIIIRFNNIIFNYPYL